MMRAMRAESFTWYGALKLVEVPRPRVTAGRILVRITAAGVSPLDHTILSGGFPFATPPLILGNEGAGVVESSADSSFPAGARVMFFGPYGVSENGTYSESIAVRREDLFLIPDNIDDATAGGMPVAYLTAQITLMQAEFTAQSSKTGRTIHTLFFGRLVAEKGKIKLLRESVNLVEVALGVFPNGLADYKAPSEQKA